MSLKGVRLSLLWVLALFFVFDAGTVVFESSASDLQSHDARTLAYGAGYPLALPENGNAAAGALALSSTTIPASKDNTLYESSRGSRSNGAGRHFFVGQNDRGAIRRAVVAFDIAGSVPPGSTVTQATLVLYMSRSRAGQTPVELHRVSTDWGEGTSDASGNEGSGASASTGDATWLHKFFDTSFWTEAGGDFSTVASATTSVGSTGVYTWTSTSQMVADVQGWLDRPGTSFGWLLLGDESRNQTTKRFDSRENTKPENRPALIVEYRPAPTLTVNHADGAPGSFFTFTGVDFPASSTAEISVNSQVLGDVTTDVDGNLVFLISTTGAEDGSYFVSSTAGSRATAGFVLDAAGPVRPKEGSGTVFDLPSGIALTEVVYLPIVLR